MILDPWHVVGGMGQAAFGSRFVVQWLASEARGASVFPDYFWYASLVGALGLLLYAIHIHDPIFIVGQSLGLVVYGRNLALRHRHRT